MAAFHQLLVRQETIFQQYSIKGYQLWLADAERAAVRSVIKDVLWIGAV